MLHVRGKGKVHKGLWWVDLRGRRNHLEHHGVDLRITKYTFIKWDGEEWNGLG
jgi:hypothetical protein